MQFLCCQKPVLFSVIVLAVAVAAQSIAAESPEVAYDSLTALLRSQDSSPQDIESAESAVNILLSAPRPTSITDTDWSHWQATAHKGMGWVLMRRGLFAPAEVEFVNSLETDAADGEISFWLATVIKKQSKPGWQNRALFYYARAASYDGPGALDPTKRSGILMFVSKSYTFFHGPDDAGLQELLQLAGNHAFPPPLYKITKISAAKR